MLTAQFGAFAITEAERVLTRDGAAVHLTPKAFDLLVVLVTEAPRVVAKGDLHARVWPDTFVSDATLVSLIKELRRVLDGDETSSSCIRTVNRVGYALALPVSVDRRAAKRIWHWVVADGKHFVLGDGENRIGRDSASAVRLDSSGVSRVHARITIAEASVTLEDLGSKNGTKVGGRAVIKPTILRDGDRVEIGSEVLIYRSSAAGLSTEAISLQDQPPEKSSPRGRA